MAKTVAKFNSYIIKYASLTECLWWKFLYSSHGIWNGTFIRFYKITEILRALWLVKKLSYIVPVNTSFPLAALKMPELNIARFNLLYQETMISFSLGYIHSILLT